MGELQYSGVRVAAAQANLTTIAQYMFWLMFRNVASDGFVFEDPENAYALSLPGCVLASPSWENSATNVTQDYVYNWTRDAAIVAIELAAGTIPTIQPLIDYVQFAQICQNSGGNFDLASFFIDGTPRNWSDQTDGPALQTLSILQLFSQLDAPTQALAKAVIAANLAFLKGAYQGETVNLWEEETGASFLARAVQLKCFQAITDNTFGIPVPAWLSTAIPWLQNALQQHWNGQYYQSLLPVPADKAPYDPNMDIVMAAIYGAVPVTDTRLLATAALLRSQWDDPASAYFYPINGPDQQRGIGPLLGRYPGDLYDGDTDAQVGDHPWWCPLPTSPSSTTGWQARSQPEGSPSTPTPPASSARLESTCRRRRPRPRRPCRAPATRCCRRSSSTAITLSSASGSTPRLAMRRASGTCPGARRRSCRRSAPGNA